MKTKNALLGMGISLLSVLLSSQTARSNTLSLPPTVSITSPADGSTFTPGGVMAITANATDASGVIDSVDFFVDGILIGTDKTPPYEATYTLVAGTHAITAKATDNDGEATTSTPVYIYSPAYGLEAITVEKYYITTAADAAQADQEATDNGLPNGPLPIGSITYRFYADLQPGYKILSIYADGTRNQSLKLSTTTSFYNNPVGSISPVPGTTKASIKNNLLALDSYLTLGAVATGNHGILKTEDNGAANNVTTAANPAGVLLNSATDLGIPLTTQDGMIAKPAVISAAFVGFSPDASAALTDGTIISNTVDVPDGAVYTTSGAVGPIPATNRVLIAQITTNGSLHYEFNLLLQNGTGPGEYYVAKNPGSGDVQFPGLMGTLVNAGTNYPPNVTITAPATNSAVHIGESLSITADAADPGDIIKKVEFFVDGVSIGLDSIAPYAATYLTVAGIHSLTAKANDSGGLQGTSQIVNIHVTNNIPVVAITAPVFNSIVNQNTPVSVVADASTTIDSVEFFVDGISIGSDKVPPYSAIYNATSIGMHFLTAKATNIQGIQKISATVNIQVINPNPVNGLENILVEKYYISNTADAVQADVESTDNGIPTGALPAGSVTYRIYADLLPDYELLAVYGDMTRNQSLKLSTSTSFYNNPVGSISPVPGTTKASLKNNLLALDSYLTLGAVATGNYGIIKSEDNGAVNNVTVVTNPAGVLLNNVPKMGIPLTTQDGMITGGPIITPAFVGFSADATAALTDGTVISNKVEVIDGSIYTPIGALGPDPSTNKVLIAQITTNGVFDYELNILLRTPDGEGQFYAAHPLSGDLFIPSLIGHFNPDANAYAIKEISGICSDSSFCLPIIANDSVKNIIGYDMVLNYDKTKVHPSGNITISNELITAGYASYAVNNNSATGEINISIFLNANAPANASFNGTGELLCIEFTKEPSVPAIDTIAFSIPYLQESYVNGVSTKLVDVGNYISKKNPFYKGSLEFWTDHSPIKYNSVNPAQYLSTTIFGVDSNCDNQSGFGAQPDLNGKFNYILDNGSSIKIIRDISSFVNVQPVINGFDASLAHKVVLNDLSFIPSIFQAIALDVNMDGVISSGDISQINQRSVKTILEFKQKWNYTNNGTSNGQSSKDWIFVDSLLLASSAYKISSTYPSNNGMGYSKAKVPVPPFCFQLPVFNSTTCNIYGNPIYTGILYGDVDGNYDSIPNDGQLKRELSKEKGSIYLNIDQAIVNGNYVDIPVSFISPEKVVSLDFAIKLQNKVKFDRILNQASYLRDALANYATDDQTVRFTSNSGQSYEEGKSIVVIRFSTANKQLSNADLTDLAGYLNGEQVNIEQRGYFTTGISTSSRMSAVQIYPNPASSLLNVISTEKAVMELTDLQGRQVIATAAVNANEKLELNTEDIANGTYLLKVYNDHFVSTQRVVIENNK